MCLILFAIHRHSEYKLILAGNRDEYYDRPSAVAGFWEDAPDVVAGRDLRAGGTWFGITRTGRMCGLTNYRDPASIKRHAPSRGRLVRDFLLGSDEPSVYLNRLKKRGNRYNGFNLIAGIGESLFWYSNRGEDIRKLPSGVYGLSNHLIDTPWPKVARGKTAFSRIISNEDVHLHESLFGLLHDRTVAEDESLPETGVGLEWERTLSPVFIKSPTYGTRSSTVLLIDTKDRVTFMERTFKHHPDHETRVEYTFKLELQASAI